MKERNKIICLEKFYIFALIFIFIIIFCISFVFADFDVGEPKGEVDSFYSIGDKLRGWINVSFDDEPSNSSLTAFDSNITLLEFLDRNEADFNCTPIDCEMSYKATNPNNIKSFILPSDNVKLIGIRVTGNLGDEPIKNLSFNVNSNAEASCLQPLQIDLLDDGEIEWKSTTAETTQNSFACSESFGCFKSSNNLELYDIATEEYCEKITFPANPSFEVGVDIIKGDTTNPNLKMKVYDDGFEKIGECTLPAINQSGKFSCKINNIRLSERKEVYVCLNSDKSTNYKIKGKESNESCGFYDINNFNEFTTDYSIFAKGGTFAPLTSFKFNQNSYKNYDDSASENELIDYINDYLSNEYDNDCEEGCIIPIKFISGKNQEINVSGLTFEYSTISGAKTTSDFYSVGMEASKINSDYVTLDIEKGDFIVKGGAGSKSVDLELDGESIIRSSISISTLPTIIGVEPKNPPALVPVIFKIILEKEQPNLTYSWNFGDGNITTTDKGVMTYTFKNIGAANVTIGLSKKGLAANQTRKTFNLNVIAPKEAINTTITEYQEYLSEVKKDLNNLPPWIKTEIDKEINIEDYEAELQSQIRKYNDGFGLDNNLTLEIMNSLIRMDVPNNFFISNRISSVNLIQSQEQLDLDVLSDLNAGEVQSSKEDYYRAINNWISDNIEVKVSSDVYAIDFKNSDRKEFFSYIKIEMTPRNDVNELYFVVNGDPSSIRFKEDIGGRDIGNSGYGIYMPELKESKTIEILYPDKIDFLNLPFYISPGFEQLQLEPEFSVYCNLNKICNKNEGEDYKNCSDCVKPLWLTIILLLIWLMIAFVIYLLMYEWYKRHYESYLFKDKRNLFNLLNFIHYSEKRGISKNTIFNILKKNGWRNEQLIYAWNKLHGKRTGMLEIPIFSLFQKREIEREIERGKIVDRPPFVDTNRR